MSSATTKRKPPNAGKGRVKGVPNKVTADLRRAFQLMLERKIDKFDGWIDRVAANDPARALDLVAKFGEFVTPKLARTEHTGIGGGPVAMVMADKHDQNL